MKSIYFARSFRKDMKRLARIEKNIEALLKPVLDTLQAGRQLDAKFLDHGLGCGWPGHRDLHLKPDLCVVYTHPCPDTVKLVRIGNHANLELT